MPDDSPDILGTCVWCEGPVRNVLGAQVLMRGEGTERYLCSGACATSQDELDDLHRQMGLLRRRLARMYAHQAVDRQHHAAKETPNG